MSEKIKDEDLLQHKHHGSPMDSDTLQTVTHFVGQMLQLVTAGKIHPKYAIHGCVTAFEAAGLKPGGYIEVREDVDEKGNVINRQTKFIPVSEFPAQKKPTISSVRKDGESTPDWLKRALDEAAAEFEKNKGRAEQEPGGQEG